MSDGLDAKELLGAYLAGDIRPEERALVERLLADDPEFRALLDGLRDTLSSVQSADIPVSPALSRQLRERLAPMLVDEATAAVLGSALAGELTSPERDQLKRYFRDHPQEKSRMSTTRQTAQWMKGNQPVASDAMSSALRNRLAAKIPAFQPVAAQNEAARLRAETQVSRETTLVRTPELPKTVSVPRAAPSLRVVAHEDPWTRRFVWGAVAAAATVALAFGIARVMERPKVDIAKNEQQPVTPHKNPDVIETPDTQPPHEELTQQNNSIVPPHVNPQTPLPRAQDPIVQKNDTPPTPPKLVTPQERVVEDQPRKKETPAPLDVRDPLERKPAPDVVKQDPKKPSENGPFTPLPQTQNNTDPQVVDNRNTPSQGGVPIGVGPAVKPPTAPVDNSVVTSDPKNTTGVTPQVAVAPTNETLIKKPTADEGVPRDTMVVAGVKGGSVEARPETGAAQTVSSAQAGLQLSSGTELITSETSRITLTLSDGTLWINVNSRARVRLSGTATTVELSGGQIAYESSKGSLTVIAAGQPVVTAAKNVDVRIENGALIVVVLGDTAKVKGKNVQRNQQATLVNPAGADAPKIGPLEGDVTLWRADDPQRTITSDPAKPKSKSKSRSR